MRSDSEAATEPEKFKTRLCNMYMRNRSCRYGEGCTFAHGEHELMAPRPLRGSAERATLRSMKLADNGGTLVVDVRERVIDSQYLKDNMQSMCIDYISGGGVRSVVWACIDREGTACATRMRLPEAEADEMFKQSATRAGLEFPQCTVVPMGKGTGLVYFSATRGLWPVDRIFCIPCDTPTAVSAWRTS